MKKAPKFILLTLLLLVLSAIFASFQSFGTSNLLLSTKTWLGMAPIYSNSFSLNVPTKDGSSVNLVFTFKTQKQSDGKVLTKEANLGFADQASVDQAATYMAANGTRDLAGFYAEPPEADQVAAKLYTELTYKIAKSHKVELQQVSLQAQKSTIKADSPVIDQSLVAVPPLHLSLLDFLAPTPSYAADDEGEDTSTEEGTPAEICRDLLPGWLDWLCGMFFSDTDPNTGEPGDCAYIEEVRDNGNCWVNTSCERNVSSTACGGVPMLAGTCHFRSTRCEYYDEEGICKHQERITDTNGACLEVTSCAQYIDELSCVAGGGQVVYACEESSESCSNGVPGSCTIGSFCVDNTTEDMCSNGIWEMNGTCTNLETGSCWTANTCEDNVSQDECVIGDWTANTSCPQLGACYDSRKDCVDHVYELNCTKTFQPGWTCQQVPKTNIFDSLIEA